MTLIPFGPHHTFNKSAFDREADALLARCAAARTARPARKVSDEQHDHDHETREGWGNEPTGNAYA